MLKPPALLIRGARQLLTLRGPPGPRRGLALLDLGLIPDGAVLIYAGLVHAVGSSRQVLNLRGARDAEEIDATGKVVMPAFVDPSACLVQARPSPRSIDRLLRSQGTDDPSFFQDILKDGAHACASLSSQTLRRRVSRLATRMVRHGTTTVGSRAPYPFDDTMALKVLRAQQQPDEALEILSMLLLTVSRGGESLVDSVEHICQSLMPKIRKRRLATAIDLAFDPAILPLACASKILKTAQELGFPTAVHADLFSKLSPVSLAIQAGATFLSGFRNTTMDQVHQLAASSTIAVFEPGADFQGGIALQINPRAMLDAGVIPGLASGFHPELSPAYSMQMILLLASRLYRFTPEEAISAGTINNAHALQIERSVGSIETGKQADVLVLNVSDYRELAYYPGINVVEKVIKRGALVYDSTLESRYSSLETADAFHLH